MVRQRYSMHTTGLQPEVTRHRLNRPGPQAGFQGGSRRKIAWVLLLSTSLLMGPVLAEGAKPNFVFILVDDLDRQLDTLKHVPVIRQLLAVPGVEFSNFFANISLCCPSRTSLLRGQYAHNHGVLSNMRPDGGFERAYASGIEQHTLATTLHTAGYDTALLGKYLNSYPNSAPRNYVPPGWTHWYVPVNGNEYTEYTEFNYDLNEDGRIVHYKHAARDYMVDVLNRKAVHLIKTAQRPFFFYIAPYAPHLPATPAPRYRHAVRGLRAPRLPSWDEADVRDKPSFIQRYRRLDAETIKKVDELYRQRVRSMLAVGDLVRDLVNVLQEQNILANTYIIFTSDNGFHLGEHRLAKGKYLAYEEDIHLPLFIRGPGIEPGQTQDALSSMIDLAPTIAELAGTTLYVDVDGRSLAGLFNGPAPADWRQAVLLEQYPLRRKRNRKVVRAQSVEPYEAPAFRALRPGAFYFGLRTLQYKYVEYSHVRTGVRQELYDVQQDPYELHNLAASASKAALTELHRYLATLRSCVGAECRSADVLPINTQP